MVTTRKKARISYTEADKSDDEALQPVASTSAAPAATNGLNPGSTSTVKKRKLSTKAEKAAGEKQDDDEFSLTGRSYQKKGRKRASLAPKKPVFDHSRILELPADVLCTILSYVPLETLYYLSISSKKLGSFLQSKSSASIWIEARKRLTVYAPKFFLNDLSSDSYTAPPKIPLAHFEFRHSDPPAEYQAMVNAEMEAYEDEAAKLPLAVPAPPSGISEFAMVRYLFCNVCYHCGKDGKGNMVKVPELLAHFCKSCVASHTSLWKSALNDFEAAITPERFVEIPDYTQFLLSLPSWKHCNSEAQAHRDQPLRPKDRKVYTGDIQQRYEEFKAKKSSMSREDLDAWVVKTVNDHAEARKKVGNLSEYLWLRNTFNRYEPRMQYAIRARNEKEIREAILERLETERQHKKADASVMLDAHDRLYKPLASKGRILENEDWENIKPKAEEYMKAYQEWREANPTMRYASSANAVTEYCKLILCTGRVSGLTNEMRLENGHYLSLPRVKAILLNQPEDMADSERPQWTRNQLLEMADDLESDLVALCHTIKKDLVRKVLLRDGKSVAKLDSWDNAKLQEILDKPDVWFNCTECKEHSSTPWNGVALHACTANAKGEKHYGNRAKGWPDKACIPIGWQPDTVELADGFKGLHTLIETLARAKHDENGVLHMESTFRFPSSHSAMALDHRWKFECGGGFCWMSCARLKEFVPHLAKHIVDGKTTLAKLAEEHKPLIRDQYAVYSHAMYPIEDDFDSDEYHSEMSFGDMFF